MIRSRIPLQAPDIKTFQNYLKNKTSSHYSFRFVFVLDTDYENIKSDVKTEKNEGAIIKLIQECEYIHNAGSPYPLFNFSDWHLNLSIIVIVDTMGGNQAGAGFIIFRRGKGNTDDGLVFRDWATIIDVCMMPNYRNLKELKGFLLACALHMLWREGFNNVAVRLIGGDQAGQKMEQLTEIQTFYLPLGFQEDRDLIGFFKGLSNEKKYEVTLSANFKSMDPVKIGISGLTQHQKQPTEIVINASPIANVSPKLVIPTSPGSSLDNIKELAKLQTELSVTKKNLVAYASKIKTLQGSLQDALDQSELRKRERDTAIEQLEEEKRNKSQTGKFEFEIARLRAEADETMEQLVQVSIERDRLKNDLDAMTKSKSPEERKENLENIIKRQTAEIESLTRQIQDAESKKRKRREAKKKAANPLVFSETTTLLNAIDQEQEKLQREAERQRRLKEVAAEKVRAEEEAKRREAERKKEEEVQQQLQARRRKEEEEKASSPPAATTEQMQISPTGQLNLVSAIDAGAAGQTLSQEQKQLIVGSVNDALTSIKLMKKNDALAFCKRTGCPICEDNKLTYELRQATIEGGGTGEYRSRYNTLDNIALCNACYASLYRGTVSTATMKMSIAEFALSITVLIRRSQVLLTKKLLTESD